MPELVKIDLVLASDLGVGRGEALLDSSIDPHENKGAAGAPIWIHFVPFFLGETFLWCFCIL